MIITILKCGVIWSDYLINVKALVYFHLYLLIIPNWFYWSIVGKHFFIHFQNLFLGFVTWYEWLSFLKRIISWKYEVPHYLFEEKLAWFLVNVCLLNSIFVVFLNNLRVFNWNLLSKRIHLTFRSDITYPIFLVYLFFCDIRSSNWFFI